MPPLSLDEVSPRASLADVDGFLWRTGYPELSKRPDLDRDVWLASYVATYLERDVRQVLLLCFLQGFRRPEGLAPHALWGAVWENLVVSEVRKRLLATGHPPPIWFWRTAHGEELDRLVEIGPERAGRSHLLSCAREPSMIAKHPVPPAALARLESLGDALAGCPQVLFAYLFGSAASGDLRPLGDVDVAVFLAPGVDRMEGRLAAIGVTTSHLGTDEVDVVVLNEAPTALAGRILATRRVITDRDPFQRQAFESLVMRQYADFRILEHRVLSGRYPRG